MRERSGDSVRVRPVVVQHSFGDRGSGGPIGALERVLSSHLATAYDFVPVHQERAGGGIDVPRLRTWTAMLREVEPDLVHVRGLGNEGFHGALAARLAGCPRVLVTIHGTVRDLVGPATARRRVVAHGLEPATLRMATHIATVCEYAAGRAFVQRHGRKLLGPVANGVDLVDTVDPVVRAEVRAELRLEPGDVAVASVGRLSFDKGHRDLAAALSLLPAWSRDRLVLVLVGDGPDAAEIRGLYTRTGVRARFLGRRLDVPRILGACDVFAFPTLHENLSNALLEAMAHGLPVVATRVGGNTEVLSGGAGRLVDAQEPAGLAAALAEVVASASMRSAMGSAAVARVRSRYSTTRMCDVLDETYQQILTAAA